MMKVAPRLQLLVMMQDLSVPYPIVDLDPSSVTTGGWLEDTSLVETYNISEEDYAKRTGEFFYCLELVFHIPDSFRKLKEKRVSQNPAASEVKVTVIFLLIVKHSVKLKFFFGIVTGKYDGLIVSRDEGISMCKYQSELDSFFLCLKTSLRSSLVIFVRPYISLCILLLI